MFVYVRCDGISAYIFFVSLCIFGNIILVNLFLAILLKNFEDNDRTFEDEEEKSTSTALTKVKSFF